MTHYWGCNNYGLKRVKLSRFSYYAIAGGLTCRPKRYETQLKGSAHGTGGRSYSRL